MLVLHRRGCGVRDSFVLLGKRTAGRLACALGADVGELDGRVRAEGTLERVAVVNILVRAQVSYEGRMEEDVDVLGCWSSRRSYRPKRR